MVIVIHTQGKKRLKMPAHNCKRSGGSSVAVVGRSTTRAKNMPPIQTVAAMACSAIAKAFMLKIVQHLSPSRLNTSRCLSAVGKADRDFNDVNRKATAGSFLVFCFHVSAGIAHGLDDLVERYIVRAVATQRNSGGVDGLD